MTDPLKPSDISDELWREYDFGVYGQRVYRIDNPTQLYMRLGGSTHRVVDDKGVVHCVPAPGQFGCVLRWKPRDPEFPVQF